MIKYITRGGVEWQIQRNAKLSAICLSQDPTPDAVFYCAARVYGAFTDLWFCMGELLVLFCY